MRTGPARRPQRWERRPPRREGLGVATVRPRGASFRPLRRVRWRTKPPDDWVSRDFDPLVRDIVAHGLLWIPFAVLVALLLLDAPAAKPVGVLFVAALGLVVLDGWTHSSRFGLSSCSKIGAVAALFTAVERGGLFWVAVACAAVAALAWLASELPERLFFRLHLRWRRLRRNPGRLQFRLRAAPRELDTWLGW